MADNTIVLDLMIQARKIVRSGAMLLSFADLK